MSGSSVRTDWNGETDAGELDEPATLSVSLEDSWRRKRTSGGKKNTESRRAEFKQKPLTPAVYCKVFCQIKMYPQSNLCD